MQDPSTTSSDISGATGEDGKTDTVTVDGHRESRKKHIVAEGDDEGKQSSIRKNRK